MRLASKIALLLSPDLHAVAARLQKADRSLQAAQDGLAGVMGGVTARTCDPEVLAVVKEAGLDLAAGRFDVIGARAELTGRGPEALLPDDPPAPR